MKESVKEGKESLCSDVFFLIPENIKRRLLKQMVTSKGTMGTGLGLFISNTVIKAKFDGSMRVEDNPDGGTIIRISIPLEIVTLRVGNEVSGK